jgi:hypothetical protein
MYLTYVITPFAETLSISEFVGLALCYQTIRYLSKTIQYLFKPIQYLIEKQSNTYLKQSNTYQKNTVVPYDRPFLI